MLKSAFMEGGDTPPATPPADQPPATPPGGDTPPATPPATPPVDFLSQFSEEGRKSQAFAGVTDLKTLEERLLTLQGTVEGKGVKVPGEGAPEAEVAAYRKAIGVPDSPDGYQFKAPEGMQGAEETMKWAGEVMHKHGIPAKAAQGILDEYYAMTAQGQEAMSASLAAEGKAVIDGWKNEFGQAFPTKMNNMRLALEQVSGPDLWPEVKAMMEAPETGNKPTVLRLLMRFGEFVSEMRGEPSLQKGEAVTTLGITPAQAQAKINAIIGDKDSPYWDAKHPQHKAIVEETNKLFAALVPPGEPEKVGA